MYKNKQATHHFPNQKKKNLDRFRAWVKAIGRKLETDEDYEYFRTKRLCHIHFIPMYWYGERRLCHVAIPTLYLTKQSRDDYWAKHIALKNLAIQSKSPDNNGEITKNGAVTNYEELVMEVVEEEIIPLNNIQGSLGSDVQESPVNLLIADTLKGENENYTDVQDLPFIELSDLIPVESNVPKPVADIIIEYVPTTDEVSIQTIFMNHKYAGDITTSEEVEKLPPKPVLSHDVTSDSTLLETCSKKLEKNFDSVQNCNQQPKTHVRRKSSKEIEKNFDSEQNCIQQPKRNVRPKSSKEIEKNLDSVQNCNRQPKRHVRRKSSKEIEKNFDSEQNCIQQPKRNVRPKSKYHGLSWEVPIRIPMEHNYSKASIVSSASHISSNGVHPKKTIITLKRKLKELQKQLKYYKQKCKVLLHLNKERVARQIKCKVITKISPKGPASHQRAIKNIINYLKRKNVGSGVSLPRNV